MWKLSILILYFSLEGDTVRFIGTATEQAHFPPGGALAHLSGASDPQEVLLCCPWTAVCNSGWQCWYWYSHFWQVTWSHSCGKMGFLMTFLPQPHAQSSVSQHITISVFPFTEENSWVFPLPAYREKRLLLKLLAFFSGLSDEHCFSPQHTENMF